MPIETAEPLTMLTAPSRFTAFKSCILSFAIFSISDIETFPTNDPKKKEALLDIIDKASKDKNDIKYHAERIKKFIDPKHVNFLDFIIATLIKFAKADHHFDVKEQKLINQVVDIFDDHKHLNFFQTIKKKLSFK